MSTLHVSLPGGDASFDVEDYSINLDSTPLDSGDTSGGVGDVSVTIKTPSDPEHTLNKQGAAVLARKTFSLFTRYGLIQGSITDTSIGDGYGTLVLSGVTAAERLNVYNVRAVPTRDYLYAVIEYYVRMAGENITWDMDLSLAPRIILAPGWTGELWYFLKQLCAAERVQISITQSEVYFGPIRTEAAAQEVGLDSQASVDSISLAQFVEVYEYNSKWVSGGPVYPPGGWSDEVEVISVNAGEYEEIELEVSGSLVSIVTPKMVERVGRDVINASVYTIVGDDGLPIKPAQWTAKGGKVTFEVSEDSRKIIMKVQTPEKINMYNGEVSQSYAFALAADGSGSRYSTLRILGTGILFDHEPLKIPTGATEQQTGTEVGETIDNPFLSNRAKVFTAAMAAANKYSGYNPSISGNVMDIRPGQPSPSNEGERVFVDQRPYRIRTASYSPGGVQYTAENDLAFGDVQESYGGLTYAQIQTANAGLTYFDVHAKGAKR